MTVCPLTAIVVISSAGGAAATASAAAFFREVRWPPFGGGAGSGAGASFGGWFAGAAGASAVGMEFEAAAGTAGCSSSAASTSSAAPASAAASATAFFCAARLPPLGVGAVTRAGAWPAPSSRSTTAAGPEQPEAPEEPSRRPPFSGLPASRQRVPPVLPAAPALQEALLLARAPRHLDFSELRRQSSSRQKRWRPCAEVADPMPPSQTASRALRSRPWPAPGTPL
mmetsp:Transcript_123837/g.396416  ORF Transcript_123837/g.396416 Transcript_123837/m.396416 type:complete len:226 (-) Transcript_123837:961-1638(-)